MNTFLASYIRTALWSTSDEYGEPLDASCTPDDLSPETLSQMEKDCEDFRDQASHVIASLEHPLSQIAHDFWLTRNRHGAGFWDSDYPEPQAKQLTEIARGFGSFDLFVGEDGNIHGH